jgi:uncharacterized protein (TIGR02145 family)
MFVKLKFKFFILLLMLNIPVIIAQKIENPRFEQSGRQIIIYYDITGAQPDQTFDIQVFCSTDEGKSFGTALKKVTGDVGNNQIGGSGKKIYWNVLDEQEKLVGNILFEIKLSGIGKFVSFTDARDGKTYGTITIGTQVWMRENLDYKTQSGSWAYENNPSNTSIYGRLYNWETANNACPLGWHLPTEYEWMTLIDNYLSGAYYAGGKLKEKGIDHWNSPNAGATNEYGYTALPGGYRDINGSFYNIGNSGYWWSSTEISSSNAWSIYMYYKNGNADRVDRRNKKNGFSIRCLKD